MSAPEMESTANKRQNSQRGRGRDLRGNEPHRENSLHNYTSSYEAQNLN